MLPLKSLWFTRQSFSLSHSHFIFIYLSCHNLCCTCNVPPACWTVLSDSLWAVTAAVCAGLQPRAQLSWKKTVAISFGSSKRFFACLQLRLELVLCLFTCCRCCCWAGGTYYARIWYAVWLWQLLPASFFFANSRYQGDIISLGPRGHVTARILLRLPVCLSACVLAILCLYHGSKRFSSVRFACNKSCTNKQKQQQKRKSFC